MAISLVGTSSGTALNGGDATASLPGGIAEDDVVYAFPGIGTTVDRTMAMTTSGYTGLADLYGNDSDDANLGAFRKVMGASPDSTAVATGGGAGIECTVVITRTYRGVDTTTPEDATTTTDTSANDAFPDPPSITTQTDGAVVVIAGSYGGVTDTWTDPSGFGNQAIDRELDTERQVVGTADQTIATAQAVDAGAWSFSQGTPTAYAWAAISIALRPAGAGTTDNLLANDVQSTSEVTAPAIGQTHAILANDVESASQLTAPNVGQVHGLLADDVESGSEVTAPALAIVTPLFAEDVESASEVTAPALGQVHGLLANDVESASETTGPVLAQVHGLLADDVESASELTAPAIGQAHALVANDVEAASEVSAPALGVDSIPVVASYAGMILNVGRLMTR